ncbi:MAG TPA: hypothetical protein VGM81_13275 [Burkholderiaceae bacterium]|jgi:hypothetical protein
MADSDDVNVKFGAQIDDLKGKLGEVQGLFKELTERFAVLAAVVAGGSAFKSFINEANKANSEAMSLSKSLGITGDEAATLNTALEDIGSNAEAYTGAFQKFGRQLQNNSATLQGLGVDVKGLNAGLITGNEAFLQALSIVGQYKAGQDQTRVAMQLFGRSVDDVRTLMKLQGIDMDEVRKKNEALNLNITQESVNASKAYKLAMNDVNDVLKGLEKTVGEGVIPLFTESAEKLSAWGPTLVEGMKAAVDVFIDIWHTLQEVVDEAVDIISETLRTLVDALNDVFGGESISAMQIFKNALGIVSAAFIGFRIGFQELVNAVKTGLQLLVTEVAGFGAVADRVLHLDFSGAKAAFKSAIDEYNQQLQQGMQKAVEIADKGATDLGHALFEKPYEQAKKGTQVGAPKGGTKTATVEDKGAQAAAAARNALAKASAEADLAVQKAYLSEAQQLYDDAYKQGLISTQQYYEASLQITLSGIDAEIAAKQKELTAARALEAAATGPGAAEAKLKAQAQEVTISAALNVLEVKRNEAITANANAYRDAARDRLDALNAYNAAATKSGADDQVDSERAQLEQLKQLRQISADDAFDIEKRLETESFAALQASLDAKAAAIHGTDA